MGLLDVDRQVKQARDDINLSLYRKALAGGDITEADLQLAKLASDDKTMGAMLAGRIMGTKDFWDYQKQQQAAMQRFAMQQALSNQSYAQKLGALRYSAGLKQQAENDKRRSIYEAALASGMSEAEALQAAMGIGNRGKGSNGSGSGSKNSNGETSANVKKAYGLFDAMANAINQVNSGDHTEARKDIDFARKKIEKMAADGDLSPSEAERMRAELNVAIELYSKGLNMKGEKVKNPIYDKAENDEELSEYTD